MNAHFEAQTVLESLAWLAQNKNQIDLPTALLILSSEDSWIDVLEQCKIITAPKSAIAAPTPFIHGSIATPVATAAAPPAPTVAATAATPLTIAPKQNAPQVKPARRRTAGM